MERGHILNHATKKVNMQVFQISLLESLQPHWVAEEKRTNLEYYQAHINPNCWSTYKQTEVFAQPYICTPIPLIYCRNLTRFQTTLHTLVIERGGWFGFTSRQARLFPFWCESWAVETEEHIAMQCPQYAHIRSNFSSMLGNHTQLLPVLSTAHLSAMGVFVTIFLCTVKSLRPSQPLPYEWRLLVLYAFWSMGHF